MNARRWILVMAFASFLFGAPARAATGSGAVPAADRTALERTLAKAFRALPVPVKAFREDRESGEREIAGATRAAAPGARAPAAARQVKVYERQVGEGEDAETIGLEVRVYLNQEQALPPPLASEGGAPETFTHQGLPGVRVSLAGAEGGRVALPMAPDAARTALTVVRLYVGSKDAEPYLARIARGERPESTPWDSRPARKASEVRTIVVEYQGPRDEVERLAKATPASPLRALLSR